MTTRRKFTGAMLAAGHGKADQCHGNGAKTDNVTPPTPPTPGCKSSARMGQDNTPAPSCKSASGKEDHVE